MKFAPKNIMLVPSEACPASCSYCFGPHEGITMPLQTLERAADFIGRLWDGGKGKITFHGGEPLCAGYDWFEFALKTLRDTLNDNVRFSIQSNLWLLDQRFTELFKKYKVRVSSSLDGFRECNDRQRGEGYFDKTMLGINLLRENGMTPYVIATVTPENIPEIPKIIDFFQSEKLCFTLRGAVPSFEHGYNNFTINSSDNARIFESVFDYYKKSPVRVRDVDAAVQAVFRKQSNLCIFSNCIGHYAAIAPDGGVYSCQRFIGNDDYRLGSIFNDDDLDNLTESAAFKTLTDLHENARKTCGDCSHFEYCNGGCLYSAAVAESFAKPLPYCNGEDEKTPYFYKNLFDSINIELAKEAADNMAGIKDGGVYLTAAGAVAQNK